MTVVSGAQWTGMIATKDATGALSAATVGPAGVLYVNGVANAAVVTIAGANPYSWTVTLPALVDGDCVSMYITATIALVPTHGVVAEDTASTVYISTRGTADPGDAMALTSGERTTLAGEIDTELSGTHGAGSWEGSGGTVVAASVWAYAARTLTEESTSVTAANPNDWTKTRGTAWTIDVILGVDLSTMTSDEDIWFTYKRDKNKDSDARSLIQISYNAGMLVLNGTDDADADFGSITILDETTGAVRLYVSEEATTALPLLKQPGDYDVSVLRTSYGKMQRKYGKLTVSGEATRAIVASPAPSP